MFKYLKIFFKGGYKIFFYYPKIVKYSRNKDKYPIEERYAFARKLCLIFIKAMDIDYNVINPEYLNIDEGVMIVPNHQSFLDSISFISISEKPILFLYKKEVEKFLFAGRITKFIDSLGIDRSDLKQSVKVLIKCRQYIEEDRKVVIFPEGTRTKDKNRDIGEFKAGSFKPVMKAKKSILPVVLNGTYRPLDKNYKKKRNQIDIKFLDLITYEEYKDLNSIELAQLVENKMKKEYEKIRDEIII